MSRLKSKLCSIDDTDQREVNEYMKRDNLAKRIAMSLFGVIICAVSVGIFKIAALGVDPFQSFMAGL